MVDVSKMSIEEKLFNVLAEIEPVTQEKSGGVPYKITTYNQVNEKVRPLLKKYRIMIIPRVVHHEKNNETTIVTIDTEFVNVDNLTQRISVGGYVGYGIDRSDKGIGKALSYALKYLFMKLFLTDIGDDEESEHVNPFDNQTKDNPFESKRGVGK